MKKFVTDENENPDNAYSELLQRTPRNRTGEAAIARHGGAMLAAGTMGIGMVLSGILAFSGMPVFFPAAGFIFFLVAGYVVKLAGEIHARHIEDAQENEEREWTLRRDIERERRNYVQLRERRRMDIERNLRDEQRKQEYEENQRCRQDDLTKFVQDKVNSAKHFFSQYSVPVGNVSVVGQSKAVIEIPFHKMPVHSHIIDLAEATLGLRVNIVPVRFCDRCGVKLVGQMVHAPTCFSCHTPLGHTPLEEPVMPIASVPSPQSLKPKIPYLPPSLQAQPSLSSPPIVPSSDTSSQSMRTVGVGVEAIEKNLLTQLSDVLPLEEDYRERMELELSGVPLIQARLNELNGKNHIAKNGKKKVSKSKKGKNGPELPSPTTAGTMPEMTGVTSAPDISTVEMPNVQLDGEVSHSIGDELLESNGQEFTEPPVQPTIVTVDRQGSVEVGASVLVTRGPFKDNVGAVILMNKKKRMAKVQLRGLNTAVNLPLDFLSSSKPIEA